jgi:hypothetical protein
MLAMLNALSKTMFMWSCKRTFGDNSYDLIKGVSFKVEQGVDADGRGERDVYIARLASTEGDEISNMIMKQFELTESGVCLSGLGVTLRGAQQKYVDERLETETWVLTRAKTEQ